MNHALNPQPWEWALGLGIIVFLLALVAYALVRLGDHDKDV